MRGIDHITDLSKSLVPAYHTWVMYLHVDLKVRVMRMGAQEWVAAAQLCCNATNHWSHTTPCATIASATFTKPAMFAPST